MNSKTVDDNKDPWVTPPRTFTYNNHHSVTTTI